jgi:hypothetical protein
MLYVIYRHGVTQQQMRTCPGTFGGAVSFLTAEKRTCPSAGAARIMRNLLTLLDFWL